MLAEDYRPAVRIWLEKNRRPVLGKGGALILEAIEKTGSISGAAKALGMSYRYVWDRLADMERVLGQPVIETHRGGATRGGAVLTEVGKGLLSEYRRLEKFISQVLDDREYWESVSLKISARNKLEGTVKEIKEGVVTTSVKIVVEKPVELTAIITKEAVKELDLKPGDKVKAVIKATEVLVAKE